MYSVVISNDINKKRTIVHRRDGNHKNFCFNEGRSFFCMFFDNTVREKDFLQKRIRIFTTALRLRTIRAYERSL